MIISVVFLLSSGKWKSYGKACKTIEECIFNANLLRTNVKEAVPKVKYIGAIIHDGINRPVRYEIM